MSGTRVRAIAWAAIAVWMVTGCGKSGSSSNGSHGTEPVVSGDPLPPVEKGTVEIEEGDVELCVRTETEWTLTKTGVVQDGIVTWTVTVARGATGPEEILVVGFVCLTNSGLEDVTLGNVIVNLLRQEGTALKVVASDVATDALNDAATSAVVVPGASRDATATQFSESPASGSLRVLDAARNDVFAIDPPPVLGPGESMDLLFEARFDNAILMIPSGESVRIEVLVSVGNATTSGGASGTNLDIDGSGTVDADEANVATLATEFLRLLPETEECNDVVELTDTPSSSAASPGVFWSDFTTDIGGGTGVEEISTSVERSVKVTVAPGSVGTISNTACLRGLDTFIVVESEDKKKHLDFPCCIGIDLCKTSEVEIGKKDGGEPPPDGQQPGDFCTFTQGGFGAPPQGNNAASLLAAAFPELFPTGLEIGLPGSGFSIRFTSAGAIRNFLPAGGRPGRLTQDLVDPLSSSAGVFAGQVLALRLNVELSAAGFTREGLGELTLVGTGTSLDNRTVAEILAIAERVLGGGPLPEGFTISRLSDLVAQLNQAFVNCQPTSFARRHLVE